MSGQESAPPRISSASGHARSSMIARAASDATSRRPRVVRSTARRCRSSTASRRYSRKKAWGIASVAISVAVESVVVRSATVP